MSTRLFKASSSHSRKSCSITWEFLKIVNQNSGIPLTADAADSLPFSSWLAPEPTTISDLWKWDWKLDDKPFGKEERKAFGTSFPTQSPHGQIARLICDVPLAILRVKQRVLLLLEAKTQCILMTVQPTGQGDPTWNETNGGKPEGQTLMEDFEKEWS